MPLLNFDNKKKRELQKTKYVLGAMIKRNVRAKYRNSFFGVIWTVMLPMLEMLVYWFVFSQIFGRGDPSFHLYLLTGTMAFGLVTSATNSSLKSIVNNQSLMRHTKLQYELFPFANTVSAFVNFLFSFAAFLVVALITQIVFLVGGEGIVLFSYTYLFIIAWAPAIFIFSYGMSLLLAALYVFFRDISYFYSVFTLMWRFVTPIFYKASAFEANSAVAFVFNLNPLTHFVNFLRDVTIYCTVPDWTSFLFMYGWAIIMLALGSAVFSSTKRKFVLYV